MAAYPAKQAAVRGENESTGSEQENPARRNVGKGGKKTLRQQLPTNIDTIQWRSHDTRRSSRHRTERKRNIYTFKKGTVLFMGL